jgi:polar amino acid transport system substrate-binding protein
MRLADVGKTLSMRMRLIGFCAVFSACQLLGIADSRAEDAIRFATPEWPPYVSSTLPESGMTAKILRDIARANHSDAVFTFLPWVRAMRYGQEDAGYVGYFPAYWTPERAATCSFSMPVGVSDVGFVERKEAPVVWERLDDLAGKTIGVVNGYANGAEFDSLVAQGRLKTEGATSDLDNLRKVALGRLPVAVVDHAVLDYYAATDPVLRPLRDEIQFGAKQLIEMTVHVCFKKTSEGVALKKLFDRGLAKIDLRAVQGDYLDKLTE